MKRLALLLFLILLLNSINAGITRGAEQDEIYISSGWYVTTVMHYAILHSTDNGETITLKYSWTDPPDSMRVYKLISDATPGVLYNIDFHDLWVSFNYGENWGVVDSTWAYPRYASGCVEGEIYKRSNWKLYRSIDYGDNFEIIVDSLNAPLSDVGAEPGELYGITGIAGEQYYLYYSNNYGQTFTETPIDTSVALYAPGGYYPELHRGTEQGEIYLVSWYPPLSYHIYHSTNFGQNFELKYASEYIDIYYWGVSYTAGIQPGSFYVIRGTFDDTHTHIYLYIDYSHDYGETFTTYFHDLDEGFVSVDSHHTIQVSNNEIFLNNYPNPFNLYTTISYQLPSNLKAIVIEIYNIKGQLVKKLLPLTNNLSPITTIEWDGTSKFNKKVNSGIYLYRIQYDNHISKIKKMILVR